MPGINCRPLNTYLDGSTFRLSAPQTAADAVRDAGQQQADEPVDPVQPRAEAPSDHAEYPERCRQATRDPGLRRSDGEADELHGIQDQGNRRKSAARYQQNIDVLARRRQRPVVPAHRAIATNAHGTVAGAFAQAGDLLNVSLPAPAVLPEQCARGSAAKDILRF